MTVSLRISENIKRRVERLARRNHTTPHAFMIGAIEERVRFEETRAAFHVEAANRLEHMNRTGKGIPATEVFDYVRDRVQGNPAARPKVRNIA